MLKTNVVGPYLTAKHLLPLLMKKKTRVIVNISSLYDSINAKHDDKEGHHNPTGSVLLASNTSKAALNMRKLCYHLLIPYSICDRACEPFQNLLDSSSFLLHYGPSD